MNNFDPDDHAASRLLSFWRYATESAQLLFLLKLGYPFVAETLVEWAKNALTNLHEDELQEVLDWMSENHWLPPGM